MLDLKLLQKNPEVVAAALAKRHSKLSVQTFEELDGRRRALLAEVETPLIAPPRSRPPSWKP